MTIHENKFCSTVIIHHVTSINLPTIPQRCLLKTFISKAALESKNARIKIQQSMKAFSTVSCSIHSKRRITLPSPLANTYSTKTASYERTCETGVAVESLHACDLALRRTSAGVINVIKFNSVYFYSSLNTPSFPLLF